MPGQCLYHNQPPPLLKKYYSYFYPPPHSLMQGPNSFNLELGTCASATCKPQGNQPFTILKISWNSKPDSNMAIRLFKKKFQNIQTGLNWGLVRRWRTAAEPCFKCNLKSVKNLLCYKDEICKGGVCLNKLAIPNHPNTTALCH